MSDETKTAQVTSSKYKNPKNFKAATLILIMIGVVLATSAPINDLICSTAAEGIGEAFGVNAMNYILSGPSLLQVPAAIIAGLMLKKVSKKTLMLWSYALFAIGGLGCSFLFNSATWIIIMRTIIGLAVGSVATCCIAIIAESFIDENKRGTMMGIWNAGMGLMGAVFGIVSGALVTSAWYNVFKIYWISIPVLVCLFFMLQKTAPDGEAPQQAEDISSTSNGKMPWGVFTINMVGYFILNMLLCGMYFLCAIYVSDTGIGDASFAGLLLTVMSVVGIIAAFLFGPVYAKTKRVMLFETAVFLCAAYLIFWLVPTVVGSIIAMCLLAIGNQFNMNYFQTHITVIVPQNQVSLALGISSAVIGISSFCATYFATFIMGITGGTMVGFCGVATVCLAVFAVIAFITGVAHKGNKTEVAGQ